jgi:partner of Y14 and mago protein
MSLQQSTVTETGERVIPGSRRPDGTVRKERRVRAGYTPQEEQQVYKSVGAQVSRCTRLHRCLPPLLCAGHSIAPFPQPAARSQPVAVPG